MFYTLYFKFVLSIIFYIIFTSLANGQGKVGVNVQTPTSVLDIDGDMKIRSMSVSTSTSDDILVIDDSGLIKKSAVSNSFFRGYLKSDFSSGTTAPSVYKITGFEIIDQPSNEFDTANSTFSPLYSGLYNIVLTLTATNTNDISTNNVVYGLVDAATNKWVMRFSVPKQYVTEVGKNSTAGVVNSFSGAVELLKGKKYYFGVTDNIKLLSNPSGNTGTGIGSYMAIELVKINK